ncbi:hypothetical protein [Thiolinea disciformis]|uniref:hypothetical protein n=1 Tax=Thiolinea disciformis TaxID=125614 RepID=UPI00036AF081|nr:hypothetical protein [Thiolinea disciformis]
MPPTRRSRQNNDLTGTHIKVIKRKNYDDYYYIMPDGKPVPLVDANGTKATRAEAIEAAHQLNSIYRKSGELVQSVINRKETPKTPKVLDSFNKVLDLALEKKAKPFRVSPDTLKEKRYKVEQYRREWGERSISSFTTADISAFLDKQAEHPGRDLRELKTL